MSQESIISLLISIIGVLLAGFIGYFVKDIKTDIGELKDMFINHVRNNDIHVNMGKTRGA